MVGGGEVRDDGGFGGEVTGWADDPGWLVAVRGPDGQVGGAGTLVTPTHVLTCAHVVDPALPARAPLHPVQVTWARDPAGAPLRGHVVAWDATEDVDVAVLELDVALAGAEPAPLGVLRGDLAGSPVGSWGYPVHVDDRPQPWCGTVAAVSGARLSLQSDPGGFEVERGFSGGGLWDERIAAVVGLVCERIGARRPDDNLPPTGIRAGVAVRLDVVARVWPDLPRRSAFGPDRLARLTTVPLVDGHLPAVTQARPDSLQVPAPGPYIRRPGVEARIDAELSAALASPRTGSPLVLLVGAAAAGKSRIAVEALHRRRPGTALLVPGSLDALAELAGGPLPVPDAGAVIWLDDVEDMLVPSGFGEGLLSRLARHDPPLAVVATLRTTAFVRLSNPMHDQVKWFANMLSAARLVEVSDVLEEAERDAARLEYPRLDLDDGRFGPQLVSAGPLEHMLALGRDVSPAGWAMLRAAVDWGRTGAVTPVPEEVLRRGCAQYLPGASPGHAALEAGLAWACGEGENAVVAALRMVDQEPNRTYRPSRYLIDHVERSVDTAPVPHCIWHAVATTPAAPGEELLLVAYRALEGGLREAAVDVLEAIVERDGSKVAAYAWITLGELEMIPGGDQDRAWDALSRARDMGGDGVRHVAEAELASLALVRGDLREAEELLQGALRSDDPAVRRLAVANQAMLRWRQGDTMAARLLLENVLASSERVAAAPTVAAAQLGLLLTQTTGRGGKPAVTARDTPARGLQALQDLRSTSSASVAETLAEAQLGWLLISQGEPERARELLTAASQSESLLQPLIQAGLGLLDVCEGRTEEGTRRLDGARASFDPYAAALATLSYGILHREQGRPDAAAEVFAEVLAGGGPETASVAAELLGDLRRDQGDLDRAEEAYRTGIAFNHRERGLALKVALAVLLYDRDHDVTAAVDLLREVADTGSADQAPRAADLLGDVHAGAGNVEAAEAAYRQAIAARHPDWTPMARIDLSLLLQRRSGNRPGPDHDEAIELLREAADSGHKDLGPRAMDLLGDALAQAGQAEKARAAYTDVVATAHPYWASVAHVDLAMLDIGDDRFADARQHLDAAVEAGQPAVTGQALLLRALVAMDVGDAAAARADLERAGTGQGENIAAAALFWQTAQDVYDGDLSGADVRAQATLDALQRWLDVPPPPTEPADDARTDLSAPPGHRVLAIWDYLYALDDLTGGPALDALHTCTDLQGWLPAALNVRRAQQCLLDDPATAVDLLRPALTDLDSHPDAPWAEQALARRFLAVALLGASPGTSREILQEAHALLDLFVTRDSRRNGPSALVELGRIKVLLGRLVLGQRMVSRGRLADADAWFREGEELLHRAEVEARAFGDDVTAEDALTALELVPAARNDLAALERTIGGSGPSSGTFPIAAAPAVATVEQPADLLLGLARTAAAECRPAEALALLALLKEPDGDAAPVEAGAAVLQAWLLADRGDVPGALKVLRTVSASQEGAGVARLQADLELLARVDQALAGTQT